MSFTPIRLVLPNLPFISVFGFVPLPAPLMLAVLSNGQLLEAPLSTLQWRRILPEVPGIAAVAPAEK